MQPPEAHPTRQGGKSSEAPPDLLSTHLLSSPAIHASISSLTSSLLDAAITPWWSRISPTNNQALHDEVDRLVGILGLELSRRLQDAEAQGRLKILLEVEIPALLQRYIEVYRAGDLGLEEEMGHEVEQLRKEDDTDEEFKTQEQSRRHFEVYNALWPSFYVEASQANALIQLSLPRIRSLADAILPALLPAEELQSRAAATLVRDLLAMLLRVGIEKGSAGWLWVRVAQKQVTKAAERTRDRSEEGEIVLLPSGEEIKSWAMRCWGSIFPRAQRCFRVCKEYATSIASPKTRLSEPPREEEQPPPYHEEDPSHHKLRHSKHSELSSSVSSNYLSLLCTLLDLESTYTGRLVQGTLLLARSFRSEKLDGLIYTSLTPHLQLEDHYLSLLSALRLVLLQPSGTLPPPLPAPSMKIQCEEYEALLSSLDQDILPLLLGVLTIPLRFALLGGGRGECIDLPPIQDKPRWRNNGGGGGEKREVQRESTFTTCPTPANPLRHPLSPLLAPQASWTRADLVGRILERVAFALVPEMEGGVGEETKKD